MSGPLLDRIDVPQPPRFSTPNVQGPALRSANAEPLQPSTLGDGTAITLWFTPNTKAKTRQEVSPPDLAEIYSCMDQAQNAILYAVFLPGESGKDSIIEKAIALGRHKSSLIVYGAVSDPMAMPNYVPPSRNAHAGDEGGNGPTPQPATYDQGNIHIVRAAALAQNDLVGNFEQELLKAGHAIIHDKIVVVDPLSATGFVVLGSHNLGYKASYENDENLVIIHENPKLIEAYAVHLLDLYEHYRFRAVQQDLENQNKKPWDGFLSVDSKWLDQWVSSDKGNLARYLAGGPGNT